MTTTPTAQHDDTDATDSPAFPPVYPLFPDAPLGAIDYILAQRAEDLGDEEMVVPAQFATTHVGPGAAFVSVMGAKRVALTVLKRALDHRCLCLAPRQPTPRLAVPVRHFSGG